MKDSISEEGGFLYVSSVEEGYRLADGANIGEKRSAADASAALRYHAAEESQTEEVHVDPFHIKETLAQKESERRSKVYAQLESLREISSEREERHPDVLPANPRNAITVSNSESESTYTDPAGNQYYVPEWVFQRREQLPRTIYHIGNEDYSRSGSDYQEAGFPAELVAEAAEKEQEYVPRRRRGAMNAIGYTLPKKTIRLMENQLRFDEENIPEEFTENKIFPYDDTQERPEDLQTVRVQTSEIDCKQEAQAVESTRPLNEEIADSAPDEHEPIENNNKSNQEERKANAEKELYSAPVHLSESTISYRKTLAEEKKPVTVETSTPEWKIISEDRNPQRRSRRRKAKTAESVDDPNAYVCLEQSAQYLPPQIIPRAVNENRKNEAEYSNSDFQTVASFNRFPFQSFQPEASESNLISAAENGNGKPEENEADEEKKTIQKQFSPGKIVYASVSILLGILCVISAIQLAKKITYIQETEAEAQQILAQREAEWQEYVNNYSLKYRELIEEKAKKYNLSPAFVAAIVKNESSFRTDATSSVGARGLMQLMDETAEWIHGKIGEGTYQFDQLYEAEPNLEYGCWYLNYLSSLFHGDPVLVAAAFHAGQREISNWLNNSNYSKDGYTIALEDMPEGPTRTYVGRVVKAFGNYQRLYYDTEKGEEL